MKIRYVDEGIHILQLRSNDHWVKCLKCHNAGILKYKKRDDLKCCCYHSEQYLFHCLHCGFHLDTHDGISKFKLDGHYYVFKIEKCHRCGGAEVWAKQQVLDIKHPPVKLEAECPLCHSISKFPIKVEDVRFQPDYKTTVNETTIFGLELYLCIATRFGQIYVYNPEHLQELKSYIQADLRERTQNTGNSSYYSRLPAWIKSARNRKEILKALLRLEQMATTIQP